VPPTLPWTSREDGGPLFGTGSDLSGFGMTRPVRRNATIVATRLVDITRVASENGTYSPLKRDLTKGKVKGTYGHIKTDLCLSRCRIKCGRSEHWIFHYVSHSGATR
jgi:hypothetical protein